MRYTRQMQQQTARQLQQYARSLIRQQQLAGQSAAPQVEPAMETGMLLGGSRQFVTGEARRVVRLRNGVKVSIG